MQAAVHALTATVTCLCNPGFYSNRALRLDAPGYCRRASHLHIAPASTPASQELLRLAAETTRERTSSPSVSANSPRTLGRSKGGLHLLPGLAVSSAVRAQNSAQALAGANFSCDVFARNTASTLCKRPAHAPLIFLKVCTLQCHVACALQSSKPCTTYSRPLAASTCSRDP